jgi:hypothetical protein
MKSDGEKVEVDTLGSRKAGNGEGIIKKGRHADKL